MPKPEVDVIICHHTGNLILRCLESVKLSQGVEAKVIVMTSDATLYERIPDWVTLYYEEGGPAHKRNVGVARSQSDTIVFLDDDVEISPYCLYELWRSLAEHSSCGMVFAKILKMEEGRRDEFDAVGSWLTWSGFLYDRAGTSRRDRGQYDQANRILSSKSATCMVRRKSFLQTGGFDRDYYILGEETDLSWRHWLRGWEVWYHPGAVSWHAFGCESIKPRADFYTIQRTMTYGCRNYLSLLWTNLGTARLLTILPSHLCAWATACVGFLCRGDTARAVGILRGVQEFCQCLPQLQRKRHLVQSTRVGSDRQLFPIICYSPGFSYYMTRMWRYWTTQLHGVILVGFGSGSM